MKNDKKAYASPNNPDVLIIPADPKAVQEAYEKGTSRMLVKSELLELYRDLDVARIKLNEDDRIIDLILQQRNQLASEIADLEQSVQELEAKNQL